MSKPVFLYSFSYKSYNYYYTNANRDVVYNNVVYKSYYISHSRIVSSTDEIRAEVQIYTDIDNPIVQLYMNFVPTGTVDLTIVRYDLKTQKIRYLYWGNIKDFDIVNDFQTEIRTAPITSRLSKIANRFTYQSNCNHYLYGPVCGVDQNQFSFLTTVTAVSEDGKTITVADIRKTGVSDDDYLVGGIIRGSLNGSAMKILGVNNTVSQVQLLAFFPINVGDEVKLSAGCNKTSDHCINKFNNLKRQNAEEFVPGRNPTHGF